MSGYHGGDGHHQIGAVESGGFGVGHPAGHITDHRRATAAPGVQHRLHRAGARFVTAARSGQHTDPAEAWQRIAYRTPAESTTLQTQVRPPQPRRGFPAQQQIDTPAPRVEIDQQCLGGGMTQGHREDRRPRPAAGRCHRDHPAVPVSAAGRFGHLGQVSHEIGLRVGQRANMLRPNVYRRLPRRSPGFAAGQQDDPVAAWHTVPPAPPGRVLVEQHRRRGQPRLPGEHGRTGGGSNAHRRGHPLGVLAQLAAAEQCQRDGGGSGHPSTVWAAHRSHQGRRPGLGMTAGLGITRGTRPNRRVRAILATSRVGADRPTRDFLPHKRDDPRQGGRRRRSS